MIRKLVIGLMLGAGLVISAQAQAQAQAPAASAAGGEPAPAKICKRMTATGSNLSKRVCATAEELAAQDRKGREGAEEFYRQRRESVGVSPVGGP